MLLVDGSEKTWSKRSAAYTLATESLQPKDYVRESFAGKTPAPLDAQRQQALRAFLQDAMRKLKVPGLSYALDRGQIVYEGGLGVREQGKNLPVDEHTLFMAASNLTVRREGKKVVFDFDEWQSTVGYRRNGDGSTSFVTTGAALSGLEFVVRGSESSQELVVRDGQHEYAFKAARVPRQVSASADAPPGH